MNKQWIYRNGEKPFSVTEIKKPRTNDFLFIAVDDDSYITHHNKNGLRLNVVGHDPFDLILYEPYADFKMDDKVNVTDFKDGDPIPAHWSGLDENGRATAFINGGTSFTRSKDETIYWKFCEKADKEDK